jgi:hypothetical protein
MSGQVCLPLLRFLWASSKNLPTLLAPWAVGERGPPVSVRTLFGPRRDNDESDDEDRFSAELHRKESSSAAARLADDGVEAYPESLSKGRGELYE